MKQFDDNVTACADQGKARRCDRRAVSHGETGLTLLEMIVVLVIIAIVAGLVTMNVIGRPDQARVTTTTTNLKTLSAALKTYRLDNGQYPTTQQGLKALVEKPTTPPLPTSWPEGGYVSENPVDAWGNPYVYASTGSSFELKSLGKDGKPGGEGLDADLDSKGG
ncbi:type II secretion system major pseudopilin GspG [Sphingomonas sp.]|uniref:type II secretion system major pseudopilin GspG n=1 Tax=Sphingomonas sp. TaxID=28214 RepID=UPI0025CD8FA6|nr:type II secretion system major pseudopilin GspG [Sphingomonas sp.]